MAPDSSPPTRSLTRVADFVSFATVGAVGLVQDLTHAVVDEIGDLEGSDSEVVAEETLCLVATATARSAEVGLKEEPEHASAISTSLLRLPYTYRDYLVGRAMISAQNPELAELGEQVRERLHRKQEFYQSHLPEGRFPGPGALGDKMELWMGRVSPPKLPESPQERLAALDLVDPVVAHCKLILAYGRRGEVPSQAD